MSSLAETPTAIGQPTRDALDGIFGIRLRRLQSLWLAHWARGIRQLGFEITPMQGGILLLIEENPGIGHSALAGLLKVEAPTLSQSLTPLVESDLVKRDRSKCDGRAVALNLSTSGIEAIAVIDRFSHRHEATLLADLDHNDRRNLLLLLDKALASADFAHLAEKNQD